MGRDRHAGATRLFRQAEEEARELSVEEDDVGEDEDLDLLTPLDAAGPHDAPPESNTGGVSSSCAPKKRKTDHADAAIELEFTPSSGAGHEAVLIASRDVIVRDTWLCYERCVSCCYACVVASLIKYVCQTFQ